MPTPKKNLSHLNKLFFHLHLHLSDAFIQSDLQCIQGIHLSFISMCVPWESNPQPFELLTQCSTTELQEHCTLEHLQIRAPYYFMAVMQVSIVKFLYPN